MQQRHYYKYTNILCNNQQLFVCIQGLQYLLLLLPCLFFLCVCMPFLCHVTQLNPWFWSYEEGCIVFTIQITIIYSILNGIEFYRTILTVNQYIISKYASTSWKIILHTHFSVNGRCFMLCYNVELCSLLFCYVALLTWHACLNK